VTGERATMLQLQYEALLYPTEKLFVSTANTRGPKKLFQWLPDLTSSTAVSFEMSFRYLHINLYGPFI
jgi:hypothetical protein